MRFVTITQQRFDQRPGPHHRMPSATKNHSRPTSPLTLSAALETFLKGQGRIGGYSPWYDASDKAAAMTSR